jgi:AcrR family transcriptional regulator
VTLPREGLAPACPGPYGAAPARRRGKALEQAIFEATLGELVASGYAKLTMEGVANAAQTGKAALYRRWPSKEELVMDALGAMLPPMGPPPSSGSVRGDLLELIERLVSAMTSVPGSAARALISDLDHERAHAFAELVHLRIVGPVKQLILGVLAEGEARGEVRPGSATAMVADVIPALMMYRSKLGSGQLGPGDPEAIVDEVLLPIVRP